MVREIKNSRAKTKKFSRRFSPILEPQSGRFWLVFFETVICRCWPIGSKV
ncbi:DUF1661 domain-containing protein [Porphyromonas sp. COT-052 OH4946]